MWLRIPSGIYSETILFICSDSTLKNTSMRTKKKKEIVSDFKIFFLNIIKHKFYKKKLFWAKQT